MTEPGFSDRPVHGRSFHVTMSVIGGLAVAQILAIGVGLLRRDPSNSVSRVAVTPTFPQEVQVETPGVSPRGAVTAPQPPAVTPVLEPGGTDAAVNDPVAPAPQVVGANGNDPVFLGPAGRSVDGATEAVPDSLFDALTAAAVSQTLPERILEALMVAGTEHRAKGNMQEALKNFRQVESALPDHPRILSELAATLGKMRLKDKADAYWERVDGLGAVGAGPYFPLAGLQLRGEIPAIPVASAPVSKPMKIGEIKVEESAPTSEGQKVSLRVVIDADPGLRPVGEDLSLLVYFYDKVSGATVRPSTADTSYLYPTEPYDWKVDGTEVIVVNYNQPVFTEEQKRELGDRSFYGYAIELYYRDELQDKVAMPEDIAALRFESAPNIGTGGAASAEGPENALFPNPVFP